MKTIGLIGGLSWESSAEYYRMINQGIRDARGGVHSARLLMYSFDFQEIKNLQHDDKWDELAEKMVQTAKNLKEAGADFIAICSNTMHKMAELIEREADIPLLHIADPAGEAIVAQGLSKVALLGTAFTMEQPFYQQRLQDKFGLEIVIPDEKDRNVVHSVIYDELVKGIITEKSRRHYVEIIKRLAGGGAQGVILGCTEIMLLVKPEDSPIPLFDTTALHAQKAVEWALG